MIGDLKQAREQAKRLAGDEPPEWGWFLWLEDRLAENDEPTIPWWWREQFKAFWRTGKRTMFAAVGLRGLKSSATCRVSMAEALFRERRPVLNAMLVLPILSALKTEAAERIMTMRAILRALRYRERERKGKGEEAADIVPVGEYAYSFNASSGLGIIDFRDASDNMVTCWARVAGMGGVRAYTGIGGIADEADHWPVVGENGKEPAYGGANRILDYLISRTTGQTDAHVYVVSNPTSERALLSSACMAGDGHESHIARLGDRGAEELQRAFATLAKFLKANGDDGLAMDERLHERQSPDAWRIPSCVGHEDPSRVIIEHWKQSCDSARRSGDVDRMGTFFQIYCARAIGGEGASYIDPMLALEAGSPERDAMFA